MNERVVKKEALYARRISEQLRKSLVPKFSFGANSLISGRADNDYSALADFIEEWQTNPNKFLDYRNFPQPPFSLKNKGLEFQSLAYGRDKARFYCDFQPKWRSGSKVGVIVLPHWNASGHKYIRGTAWIRRIFLPVNTAIYLPEYEDDGEYFGRARYNVVGPNLGLTIRRVQQDVLNIQLCAQYLRKEFGCEKIGICSYSIGSLRGFLSAVFAPKLFDFLLLHLMCDSFAEAVMDGVTTKEVAKAISKNISRDDLERVWSIISPGYYVDFMHNLPLATRVIQGKYDLVFGVENVEKINRKLKEHAPYAELFWGEFGHATIGDIRKALPVLSDDINFIYRNSGLKYW